MVSFQVLIPKKKMRRKWGGVSYRGESAGGGDGEIFRNDTGSGRATGYSVERTDTVRKSGNDGSNRLWIVGLGAPAVPRGQAFNALVRPKYMYGLTIVEMSKEEDEGWMVRALKVVIDTRTNLHELGRKKLCELLQWDSLKELEER